MNERKIGAEFGGFGRGLEKAGLLGAREPLEDVLADPRKRRRKAEGGRHGAIVVVPDAIADRVRQDGVAMHSASDETAGEFSAAIGFAIGAADDGVGLDVRVDLGV